jgi:hypothetical protein
MKSTMIAATGAFLLVAAGLATAEEARAAAENRPAQPTQAQRPEVVTVSGSVRITVFPAECPACGEGLEPLACFAGLFTGDLDGTFTSALFENPFRFETNPPNSATLRACSNIAFNRDKKLVTEDKIFARKNAGTIFGFDVTGELLTVVGGDCQGMIALLGDALQGTSYVGRLVCPARRKGPPANNP